MIELLQLVCIAAMGVLAGIYFIFSNTIMAALKKIETGALAMTVVNDVILNPTFKALFFLSAVASVYLGFIATDIALVKKVGFGLFFVGTFMVTLVKNVPANNRLKAAAADPIKLAETWKHYLQTWVFWNHVRSYSALISLCLVLA